MSEELISLLQKLGVLSSSYDIRVLSYLVFHPQSLSGKEISEGLQLSDSKIYPSLNRLIDLELITKDDTDRPNRYSLAPPNRISGYLRSEVDAVISEYNEILQKCTDLITTAWNQANPLKTKLSKIYRDNEIVTEILSLSSVEAHELQFILGRNAKPYLSSFGKVIQQLLANNQQINLSMPHSREFMDVFEELLVKYRSLINLKQCELKLENYVVVDPDLVFAIVHQNIADIVFYSDDKHLIGKARGLWSDPKASIQFHRLIRSE
jgi:sugar-specific transcriptional regulator TrmB